MSKTGTETPNSEAETNGKTRLTVEPHEVSLVEAGRNVDRVRKAIDKLGTDRVLALAKVDHKFDERAKELAVEMDSALTVMRHAMARYAPNATQPRDARAHLGDGDSALREAGGK